MSCFQFISYLFVNIFPACPLCMRRLFALSDRLLPLSSVLRRNVYVYVRRVYRRSSSYCVPRITRGIFQSHTCIAVRKLNVIHCLTLLLYKPCFLPCIKGSNILLTFLQVDAEYYYLCTGGISYFPCIKRKYFTILPVYNCSNWLIPVYKTNYIAFLYTGGIYILFFCVKENVSHRSSCVLPRVANISCYIQKEYRITHLVS